MSVTEQIRSASPRQKIILAILAAVVAAAALSAVYVFVLQTPYDVLFTKLRPTDAATIVAELDKKKTPYRLQDSGTTILVPAKAVDGVRLDVMSQDLPLKGVVGFELFNKSDMGLTEFAQKINYQRALQGELERTIMGLDTIDTARVHLSLPDTTLFRDDRRPPKASVTLIPRPGKEVSPETVRGVQRLVAASTPDLDPANVVVLDEHGVIVSGDTQAESAVGGADLTQRGVEQYYSGRIHNALDKTLPNAGLNVTVHAEASQDLAGGPLDLATALSKWTPGSRTFALRVDVSLAAPMSSRLQEEVRGVVGDTIGMDPALGDVVSLSTAAPSDADAGGRLEPQPPGGGGGGGTGEKRKSG
jgi:flagellar M-ring protein FliF